MIAQLLQEDLAKALSAAVRFTAVRAQLPILGNLLFKASGNKMLICATNLELSFSTFVGAKVEEEGEIAVPARVITEIITNLRPGQINFKSEKENLDLSSGKFKARISGAQTSDFPQIPQRVGKDCLIWNTQELRKVLGKILFSISNDQTRPVLTGALLIFEKSRLNLVASDGFRLTKTLTVINGETEDFKVILPKNILSELPKLTLGEEEIKLALNKQENQIVFAVGDMIISSRIIQGNFPDFEKIIPEQYQYKILTGKREILEATRLAMVFARETADVIKINVKKDTLTFQAESSTVGRQEGEIEAKIENTSGEDLEIAFNGSFLTDWLNSIEGENVEIRFGDASSPGVFLDSGVKDDLHLIMPVKV